MDAPYYTIELASAAGGWSYTCTHDPAGDPPDPDTTPVFLSEPFTYAWGFENDLIPGHLMPFTSKATLWCVDAAAVPAVDIGDLLTVSVRIGTDGPFIIQPPPLRVAAAEVEIVDDDDDYQARLDLSLTDTLADLNNLYPVVVGNGSGFSAARFLFRPRLAEIAYSIGRSIGCPTWWEDEAAGHTFFADFVEFKGGFNGADARTLLTHHLNSAMPGGLTHTICVDYREDWPFGYRRVGPDTEWYESPITEPDTLQRFLLVPASRRVGGHSTINVAADWCLLPAVARRSREYGHNTIRLSGMEGYKVAPDALYNDSRPGVREVVDTVDRDARGAITREVATALELGDTPGGEDIGHPHTNDIVTAIGLYHFMGDDTAKHAAYCYDDFDLLASELDQASAEIVLPALAPRLPGETDGDGHVLRHITITDIQPSARFDPDLGEVTGFIYSGQLTVADGDLTFTLAMTPGEPITF